MMKQSQQEILRDKIINEIHKGCLKRAFDQLFLLSDESVLWKAKEQLEQAQTTYQYLLDYEFQGLEDQTREEIYSQLKTTLCELVYTFTEEKLLQSTSNNLYIERKQVYTQKKHYTLQEYTKQLEEVEQRYKLSDLDPDETQRLSQQKKIAVEKERLQADIFIHLLVDDPIDTSQQQVYQYLIGNPHIPVSARALAISAITINLLQRIDYLKFKTLLHSALLQENQLVARSIVGIVLALMKHHQVFPLYSQWQEDMQYFFKNDQLKKTFEDVLLQLIRAQQTEEISHKIDNELFGQMRELSSKLGLHNLSSDWPDGLEQLEENPQWQKEIEEMDLRGKFQEFAKLQQEGSDVLLSSFQKLKNFPFFSDLANWFVPFDRGHSQFVDLASHPFVDALQGLATMCDSDKYSLMFSILQMPDQMKQMLLRQHSAELFGGDSSLTISEQALREITNQYLQNLYRFFKLYTRANSLENIFQWSVDFLSYETIKPFIDTPQALQRLANFALANKQMRIAECLYLQIVQHHESETEQWWQKIGYAREKEKDVAGALEAYLRAYTLQESDNSWTLKRIAHCYRLMKQPEEAYEYLLRVEKMETPTSALLMNIGHCLLEMGKYEEALRYYFRVEFEQNEPQKVQRPIAWTALLAGKYELADSYYASLEAEEQAHLSLHDYLNIGHLNLVQKKLTDALIYYKKAQQQASSLQAFVQAFTADIPTLLSKGVSDRQISRLLDKMEYEKTM